MTKIPYVRLYTDPEGESHFSDEEIDLQSLSFAPPAPPVNVSTFVPAKHFVVIQGPEGWFGDWHPTPYRQYFFWLRGEVEVRVSDGETRRFKTGNIILVEDTAGKGHMSRFFGGESILVSVQLA